jgi:hypothetical protein
VKTRFTARQCPRYAVHGLRGSFEIETRADLLNISLFGISVRAAVALEVGKQVACALGEEPNAVSVRGGIIWCRPASLARDAGSGPEGHFDIGIFFEEDLRNKAGDLLRFLDSSSIVKLTKGVYGRFELDYEIPVRLQHRHELRVRQLGSLGLLAEADTPLSLESHTDLELLLEDRRFISRARVAWVRESGDGVPLRLGLEFFQPTERHTEMLRSYIRETLK